MSVIDLTQQESFTLRTILLAERAKPEADTLRLTQGQVPDLCMFLASPNETPQVKLNQCAERGYLPRPLLLDVVPQ